MDFNCEIISVPKKKIRELDNDEERETLKAICDELSSRLSDFMVTKMHTFCDEDAIISVIEKSIDSGIIKIYCTGNGNVFMLYYSLAHGAYVDAYVYSNTYKHIFN